MGKKVDNLYCLVRDLESRYGADDIDVQMLKAELDSLECCKVRAAEKVALVPRTHSLAKHLYRGSKPTELR
jgi:hypothetical protein